MNGAPAAVRLTPRTALGHARTAVRLALEAAPGSLAGLAVLAVATGLAPVVTAWLTRFVLDGLVGGMAGRTLVWAAVALAVTGIAAVILPRLAQYAESELGRRVRVTVADRLYSAMNDRLRGLARLEDPRFHDRIRLAQQSGSTSPGDLVNSVTGIGRSTLTLSGFLVTLLLINPWLLLAVAVAAVPTARAEVLMGRRRVQAMWRIGHAERRQYFYANLLSAPREAKEVRLFGLGAFFRDRMLTELRSVNAANRALDRREVGVQGLLGVLGAAVAGGGLVWAVLAARAGLLTVGDVTVFVAALAGVQGAISGIVAQMGGGYQALLMLDHYRVATTVEPDLPVPAAPTPVTALTGGIEFRDVWFRYGPDRPWVLRGVDLTLPAGRTTALVGLNGAGKSTLVKLLCRLYDPVRGRILWDGTDLREIDPAELRERIGTVFQDYVEYELSAAENIGLGNLARLRDRDRIEAAARRAGVHQVLASLPNGYDTMLTRMFVEGVDEEGPETGMLLSGGQGQRLALARALLRDERDLLILDEPSSGLDAEAEAEIHTRLREHRAGRTSLLISHRLNTIRDADLIAVLSDGRIAEHGEHHRLIAEDGAYARLFNLQARGYTETAPR
ncbi:ABC transporter ATP-binding protein [Planomonospora parontospora]|uniref:ABC transporter ATP-binding protein n=1 Tax=Planomonospora parontospora TaxID=58119 RepID=UPI0016714F4C|nr:ABC transporter ATP-binding protein [Planomonospora parontospora]GGL03604.1 multidrug ABC transporter permease [Planomonospora parontospora subsp. antibiotica]GII13376.1 multidrug ABC transporter permease [Planomonospora parontospora subsp. antibiotica]